MSQVRLGDLLGSELEEEFVNFDLTEIQGVLATLGESDPIDLVHAERLQQLALRGADILTEYLGKIVKTVSYLESKVNSVKNKVSLEYKSPDGGKATTDMRVWAAGCAPEVDEINLRLSKAKASKVVLEKKYDLLIKSHHHYKDIALGLRKTVLGYSIPGASNYMNNNIPEGYE